MLTKERLDTICKYPITKQDMLIKSLYFFGGVSTVEKLAEDLNWTTSLVNLHIKKSYYIIKEGRGNRTIVKLVRKGKESQALYEIPEKADTIHDFVFSILVENYGYSFKTSLERVLTFCQAKNIDYSGYLKNENIFSTIKKEVRIYLQATGQFKY